VSPIEVVAHEGKIRYCSFWKCGQIRNGDRKVIEILAGESGRQFLEQFSLNYTRDGFFVMIDEGKIGINISSRPRFNSLENNEILEKYGVKIEENRLVLRNGVAIEAVAVEK